ncbi:hypothetical protein [Leucothrix arctica]|uniref:Uncharacterized protein n=1 Tax=Leucothrix arctica TaxID=1481894 RepID=A0A317CL32_9GAMM|nr:hypothetical protein [Leucothrix arctica]PWQ98891.1 hypothetical protein DKT75_01640 [Leucothrix arctica]
MKYLLKVMFLACFVLCSVVLASEGEQVYKGALVEAHGQQIDAVLKRFNQTATITVLDDGAKQYVLKSETRALPHMCDGEGNYINIGLDGGVVTHTYLTDKTGVIYEIHLETTSIKAGSYGCGSLEK